LLVSRRAKTKSVVHGGDSVIIQVPSRSERRQKPQREGGEANVGDHLVTCAANKNDDQIVVRKYGEAVVLLEGRHEQAGGRIVRHNSENGASMDEKGARTTPKRQEKIKEKSFDL